ncbi:MAG: DNA mismatch endonuclease Vsr [Alphaproteobacteria bacterium]|nr:DNA mismatch endonuclease Vsr [Alphaproteobacteria bacterium]
MADKFSTDVRSRVMAAVKGRDTIPEKLVRSTLYREGFRFRLHRRDLPGNPDIVLPRYRSIVFVHGCFWHGHDCRKGRRRPQSRSEFWTAKLEGNIARDCANQVALTAKGWKVFTVWTCQTESDTRRVLSSLRRQRNKRLLSTGASRN